MINRRNDKQEPRPTALIVALVVAVIAVGTALAVAVWQRPGRRPADPIRVAAVPAPHADSEACHTLLHALPQQLGNYRRAGLAAPAPLGAAAWTDQDSEAVVLRCGLDRPADFVVGSPIQVVNKVKWFEVREGDRSTWYVVDRKVYLALTLPPGSGPAPIQELSDLVAAHAAAEPIRPAATR